MTTISCSRRAVICREYVTGDDVAAVQFLKTEAAQNSGTAELANASLEHVPIGM